MAKTTVPRELVLKAWAKTCWEAGLRKAFFQKFTGKDSSSIVQIKTERQKGAGDSINIPLLLPLKGRQWRSPWILRRRPWPRPQGSRPSTGEAPW